MDIKEIIFKTLNFDFKGEIETVNEPYVYVKYSNGKAVISNGEKSFFSRGLTLLAKGIKEGKEEFEIKEKPSFVNRMVQFELSRNAVIKVEEMKRFFNYLACMGFNSVILYMEDTYELKDYPFFGYMRGAYSEEELRAIDDYGYELGIEVIPHIQVLGHLGQYLRWPASAPVRCSGDVLLCGEEETYKFIEAMVSTMARCFRTNRLHIGCDEAYGFELGEYANRNGLRPAADVLNEHTARVLEICKKYNKRAMMYSDMFFKSYSKTHKQFDYEIEFPPDVADHIPDVDLAYWDYGHVEEEEYDILLSKQKQLGKPITFFCGVHGWGEILPRYEFTRMALPKGLRSAIRIGITDVCVTTWGGGGNETCRWYDMFDMPIFSELCFKGLNCDMKEISDMQYFLYGIKPEFFSSVSTLAFPYNLDEEFGISADTAWGRNLFYTDILYNLTCSIKMYDELKDKFAEAAKAVKGTVENAEWKIYEERAIKVYDILALKADMMINIRKAYHNGDKAYLVKVRDELLDRLTEMYRELLAQWEEMWMPVYKVFGWEVINGRMSLVIGRLEYAKRAISRYLSGENATIEELETNFIDEKPYTTFNYTNLVSTSATTNE